MARRAAGRGAIVPQLTPIEGETVIGKGASKRVRHDRPREAARTVHEVALAELSDRFAIIVRDGRAIG